MKIQKNKIIYIIISLILTGIIVIILSTNPNSSIIFLIECAIISFYFLCILFVYRDRFSPYLFLIISLALGILDVVLVVLDLRIVTNKYPIYIYEKTLFIIILWLFTFSLAFNFTSNKNKKISLKISNKFNKLLKTSNIKMTLIIFCILYIYVIYKVFATIIKIGGIEAAMVNSAVFRYNNQGYLAVLLALCAIIPICFLELNKNKMAFITMISMILILILTGRRGLIINSLILPFMSYYNYRRKKITNKTIVIVGGICAILILFIGNLRGQSSVSSKEGWLANVITDLTVTTQMGENLPDTIYALDSGMIKYQHFKYLNRGIIGMIPRAIWKNKPELIDHSMIVSKLVYNIDTFGRPIGAFGFAYLCFGILGVIIFGLITGFITKKFYMWMIENNGYIHIFLYSILVMHVMNIIKPEAVINIITFFVIILVSTIISEILNKKKGV